MPRDSLFIWPHDGLEDGETIESKRDVPLLGFFAVKFGRKNLERALGVFFTSNRWQAYIDGYLIAPPSEDWQEAFGRIWKNAEKFSTAPILLGRRISPDFYFQLIKTRAADRERGIDLNGPVDLNQCETPF